MSSGRFGKTLRGVMAAALTILLLAPIRAGGGEAPSGWTLERLLAASLANHPLIKSRRSEIGAAAADKKGAEWARYPTPSIEAAYGDNGDSSAALRLDQPVWTGGRITAGIEAAASRLDVAGATLNETRLEMTLRVIAAYSEAMRQKAREGYADIGVAEHEKLLAMIDRRVKQQVSSQIDHRLAESRLFQAQNDLSLISQARQNALTQLSQLSGSLVSDIDLAGLDEVGPPASLEEAQARALAVSPSMRRLRHQEAAATADIKSRRSAYFPQVVLRLEHLMSESSDDSRGMVVLQAQPGAGLSATTGVEAAIARREAILLSREAVEREIRERITLDWHEWTAARSRFAVARQSSEIANEVFESYTRQYVIGRKSWIDVLNAVRETMLARFTQADAQAQSVAAGLRLQAQIGAMKINE